MARSSSTELEALFEAIREECSPIVWSRGVELVRADSVSGEAEHSDEIVLRVKTPGRAIAPTVRLYIEDEEWDCDCPDRNRGICEHVAAAIIALKRAREKGSGMPSSKGSGAQIQYRFSHDPAGLRVERWLISPPRAPQKLTTSLTSILARKTGGIVINPTHSDLAVDRFFDSLRGEVVTPEHVGPLFKLIGGSANLQCDGHSVQVSHQPVFPRGRVYEKLGTTRLKLFQDPSITALVAPGTVRCTDVLRPIGEIALSGSSLQKLPRLRKFQADEIGVLVTDILPRLSKNLIIEIKTDTLPSIARNLPPRLLFEIEQDSDCLQVLPLLVYGDPPQVRIDGDNMVYFQGSIPMRDLEHEQRLTRKLRDQLNMIVGKRIIVYGHEAANLARRLQKWDGDVRSQGVPTQLEVVELQPIFHLEDDRLSIEFRAQNPSSSEQSTDTESASTGSFADPRTLLAAWKNQAQDVPLVGGGWAPLPLDWLTRHGHQLSALLSSVQGETGKIPTAAMPALAKLCDDLEHPRPPDFEKLAPLLGKFEKIPAAQLPEDLTANLRPYQREGVNWLCFIRDAGLGAVLADDMGLGKTLQTLCAIKGRSLVVCPTSVIRNWAAEIQKFRPSLTYNIYHGSKRQLNKNDDVTITSYALMRLDSEKLAENHWDTLVLDEAQNIKNPDSQVAQAAYAVDADFKLTLSGTPVENRLEELWSQFHIANRGLLGGRSDFQNNFARPISMGDPHAAVCLRDTIKPFLLRRLKSEVAKDLPSRTDITLRCELSDQERIAYDTILAATQKNIIEQLESGKGVMAALEALLRLRQAACHRALVPGQHAESSSKVEMLVETLELAIANGHRALVFSQWTSLLDLIEPHLQRAQLEFVRLDGATRDRHAIVESFQADDGPPVMLLSLKAGGTGLNLTAADHVFILDPWWNPAVEDQAADRAHRIGQEQPVMVYRLVSQDTVEERILALQSRKRALADAALGEANLAASVTKEDLLALLE